MRRIAILVFLLGLSLAMVAAAQQPSTTPHKGKYGVPCHKTLKVNPNSTNTARSYLTASATNAPQTIKFYDLTLFSNGTWAQLLDVNDWGVAVGMGDTGAGFDPTLNPPRGFTRPIGVPLIGPRALQWFDLGTFGGESFQNTVDTADTVAMAITNTGMIVGLAPTPPDDSATATMKYVRAFVWQHRSGLIDLGALEDLGYEFSNAIGTNRLGTIVAGWSGADDQFTTSSVPVAWTPHLQHDNGGLIQSWKIHQLDTTGYQQFPFWAADRANNFGQVVGFAWNQDQQLAFVWNPLPGGGWKILPLPVPRKYRDFINTYGAGINEKGEIVGNIWSADYSQGFAVLWQPLDPYRWLYRMTILGTPSGIPDNSSYPASINDLGDIVGTSYDVDGNALPTYWSTKKPNLAQPLDFNGFSGAANRVNNLRQVVGTYWSDTCANGCAAAMQFRIGDSGPK